jgi:hypothetical protein
MSVSSGGDTGTSSPSAAAIRIRGSILHSSTKMNRALAFARPPPRRGGGEGEAKGARTRPSPNDHHVKSGLSVRDARAERGS